MTPGEMRAAHAKTLTTIQLLYRSLDELPLPDYFTDPDCCDSQELKIVTEGYSQLCGVEITTDAPDDDCPLMTGFTDGWSDMTESGETSYLCCMECGAVWQLPEDLEWS